LTELEVTQQQKSFKVLLVGESCIDEYHYGVCERICAEAPVPVFDYIEKEIRPGMASNVRENLMSFGVDVEFITNDPNLLIKRRFVDTKSNQLLLREDITNTLTSIEIDKLIDCDAIVISDYSKGFLSEQVIDFICTSFSGPIFIDSKNPNLKIFKNAIIKINSDEENKMISHPINSELIVTLGKSGAKWKDKFFAAPKVDVFDVTGAGDIFLATLCYFYLLTQSLDVAISKAVYLASKSVQYMGVYKLAHDDVMEVLK